MDDPQQPKNNKNIFSNQEYLPNKKPEVPEKQAISLVANLPTELDYDVDVIFDFLKLVFGDGVATPESVLTWFVPIKDKPYYPEPSLTVFASYLNGRQTGSLYYSTSTVTPDAAGKLYNRQEQFVALYVLVLDDIGTKVPISAIPEEFKPTYIIESSPGNFQYGYVLKDPIRDLDHANALVALVYGSGLTDGGGAMPNKLVRLPGGLNGKDDYAKGSFPVRLVHMDGDYWAPQGILTAIDSEVKWDDVIAGCDVTSTYRGASKWSPSSSRAETTHGINDVVLEWMYEKKLVSQDLGDWVQIRCPNAERHSDGKLGAYYSPLGRGGEEFSHARGFKCMHGGCKTYKTYDFLQWVSVNRGPEMPVRDPCAALVRDYIFDAKSNLVWRVTDAYRPIDYDYVGFSRMYPGKVKILATKKGELKIEEIKETALWLNHPGRVTVHGTTTDMRTRDRLVTDIDGRLKINLFARSDFGTGDYDQAQVDRFMDFLRYLIPKYKERDYFLDWLTAKYQDMSFRGNGILMIATAYGAGRGTLADMIHMLFGEGNAMTKKFADIVNPKDGFNNWQSTPLVIVNETKSTDSDTKYTAAFEAIKELIDVRPVYQEMNTKHVKKTWDWVFTSWLLFSNHAGAIAGAENDRRLYVISNPPAPAPAKYFVEIEKWMNERENPNNFHETPIWAKHVGRWLSKRKPDLKMLKANAPMTSRKKDMIAVSQSDLTKLVIAIVKEWPCDYIISEHVEIIVSKVSLKLSLPDLELAKKAVWKEVQNRTLAMFKSSKNLVRVNGKRPAVRLLSPERLTPEEVEIFEDEITPSKERKKISSALENAGNDLAKIQRDILTSIEEMG